MNWNDSRYEIEQLDLRRSRIEDILEQGFVSPEVQGHLVESLNDINRRIVDLRFSPQPAARVAA